MSTQNPPTGFSNTATQSIIRLFNTENSVGCKLSRGVRTKQAPLPPAFDICPPANHQQRGQCLGHVPSLALTGSALGLELLAEPRSGLHCARSR